MDQNAIPCQDTAWKGILLYISIQNYKMSIAQHDIIQHIYIDLCYFSTRNKLLVWQIHVTYLDDWKYKFRRVVFRISAIVMVGVRINEILD